MNYYKKGVFSAKTTDGFINTVTIYSEKVNKLDGKHLDSLMDFCTEYNARALKLSQEVFLRAVAISFERNLIRVYGCQKVIL